MAEPDPGKRRPPESPLLLYTERFFREYAKAPERIQGAFDKQVLLLVENRRHPSLRAKKYDTRHFAPAREVWQARVDGGWRFYIEVMDSKYLILSVKQSE